MGSAVKFHGVPYRPDQAEPLAGLTNKTFGEELKKLQQNRGIKMAL